MSWDYDEAVAWLYARRSLGIKLGLDKVHRLLDALGRPQERFQSVHVAGTNGKGTVVHLMEEAMRRSGHRVGATTSPHLERFTERVRIDGEPVSPDTVAEGLARVREACRALDDEGEAPTFFEASIALAFLCFAEAGVDWAVVETGMGGRLDATNVLRPALSVITNVELDHTAHLGNDIADIAYEKAGIMKTGVPCVTGATGRALVVLKGVSHDLKVPMSILGEDYHVLPDVNGMRLVTPEGEAHYDLALAGEHQIQNAAVVVAAVDALRGQGVHLPHAAVATALAEVQVPGRIEVLHRPAGGLADGAGERDVELLLDGAHNPAGARALRRYLLHADWLGYHLVTGVNADKDWPALLSEWVPLAGHVWGVPLRTPRTVRPAALQGLVTDHGIPYDACADVTEALERAVRAGAERIVVAGSLFLVGEARAVLHGRSLEEIHGAQ